MMVKSVYNKPKWLFLLFILMVLTCVPALVKAQERSLSGAYVTDAMVSVPAGAYTTFSTMHDGKRYYLGIDTLQAKAGKDTVAWFDKPCYEAIWVVGGLYSPTGDVLGNKNYLRTIKSVWIEEKCTSRTDADRKRYLALGTGTATYSTLSLQGFF